MLSTLFSLPLAEIEYLNGTQSTMRIVFFLITIWLVFIVFTAGHANGRAPFWTKYLAFVPGIAFVMYFKQYWDYALDGFVLAAGQISANSAVLYKTGFIVSIVSLFALAIACPIATKRINEYKREI